MNPYFRRMITAEKGNTILCVSPYRYRGVVRDAVLDFKFHGQKKKAEFFAQSIVAVLPRIKADKVFCVPISSARMRKRGYNQAELLACEISRMQGVPFCSKLKKTCDNKVQHELSLAERKLNVKNVYSCTENLQGQTVLLVDDIVTSGATLSECARVLEEAGAKKILCAAVADVQSDS